MQLICGELALGPSLQASSYSPGFPHHIPRRVPGPRDRKDEGAALSQCWSGSVDSETPGPASASSVVTQGAQPVASKIPPDLKPPPSSENCHLNISPSLLGNVDRMEGNAESASQNCGRNWASVPRQVPGR